MTPEAAEIVVAGIKNLADIGDDEGAHNTEDFLYHQVVKEVALLGSRETMTYFDFVTLVDLAKVALKTESLKFERWCA